MPEYLIVDLKEKYLKEDPYKLSGHRLDPVTQAYVPIALDPQGRLESMQLGLFFAPDPEGWGLALVDRNGKRLPTPEERADAEKERADAAEQRVDAEKGRADAEKERADAAEQRADAEKERADAEAQARAELEKRLAELEGRSHE